MIELIINVLQGAVQRQPRQLGDLGQLGRRRAWHKSAPWWVACQGQGQAAFMRIEARSESLLIAAKLPEKDRSLLLLVLPALALKISNVAPCQHTTRFRIYSHDTIQFSCCDALHQNLACKLNKSGTLSLLRTTPDAVWSPAVSAA